MSPTRLQLVAALRDAFEHGPADRGGLLETARQSDARPEILALLARLPRGRYDAPRDVWGALIDTPVRRLRPHARAETLRF